MENLLSRLENTPEALDFSEVIQVIDENYSYTETDFQCGEVSSEAGSNEGSCKILAFAKLNNISEEKTPYLFGRFYREDVLGNPNGENHGNIRNFIKFGWTGVSFQNDPLIKL